MTPFIWCAVVGCGILALSLILDGLTDGLDDIFFDGSLPVIAAALGVFVQLLVGCVEIRTSRPAFPFD